MDKPAPASPTRPKIWINGHEWAKRQALRAGIGFTELSNGFASCEDPGALQLGTIEVFAQRWMHRIPMPFGSTDRDAGYWRECSMRQVEVSRTYRPRRPAPGPVVLRGADRRQPGPPRERGDHLRSSGPLRHPGTFRTAIDAR
jgi:hypothetical protein